MLYQTIVALVYYIKNQLGIPLVFALCFYLVNPFGLGHYFGYLLFVLLLLKPYFLKWALDFNFVLIFIFSLSYAVFYTFNNNGEQGAQYSIIYASTPFLFYILGKYLALKIPEKNHLFYAMFGLAVLLSTTPALSTFSNFMEGGFVQLDRNLPNFWTKEPVSATIMGAYFTLNMAIPAVLIGTQGKKGIGFTLGALLLFLISLICTIRLGSRTQLAIFILTAGIALVKIIPRQNIKQNTLLFLLLGLALAYILRNVSFDLDADWLTTFAGRMEDGGSSISSGGGRTEKWAKSLENLYEKPLGWDLKEFGYSHNLWLDTARVAGLIPFILLVVITIRSFKQVRLFVRTFRSDLALSNMVRVYFIALALLFIVEPILDGVFPIFALCCLFLGIINQYITKNTNHDQTAIS